MIKAIIVDDERLARQELKSLLKNFPEINLVDECANAQQALKSIAELQPDLIFLDIQMPGKNGFDMLRDLEFAPKIIFISAYDEYAIRAFEVNAIDYLLKPVQTERLGAAIKRAIEKSEKELISKNDNLQLTDEDQVFVKDGERCWFVKLSEIRLFESEGNYVRVYFGQYRPLILRSLNYLDERLSQKSFFRASRKHIINLKWIESMEGWFNGGLMVKMKGGEQIEISRRQAAKFKDIMSL
jgi:two-component system LytT family response regulator